MDPSAQIVRSTETGSASKFVVVVRMVPLVSTSKRSSELLRDRGWIRLRVVPVQDTDE